MAAFIAPIAGLLNTGLGILNANSQGNAYKSAGTELVNQFKENAIRQQGAVDTGTGLLKGALTQEQNNIQPYLNTGTTGTNRLQDLLTNPQSALENTPGYQFQLAQGSRAINNTAAASGLANSGNTLEALTQYGQGLAGTTYQNAIQNALAAAGQGLTASQQYNTSTTGLNQDLSNLTYTGAKDIGSDLASGAQATAASILGKSGATSNIFSNIGNGISSAASLLPNLFPGTFGPGAASPVPFSASGAGYGAGVYE